MKSLELCSLLLGGASFIFAIPQAFPLGGPICHYQIQEGDDCDSIAFSHSTTVEVIYLLNRELGGDCTAIGQTISVPCHALPNGPNLEDENAEDPDQTSPGDPQGFVIPQGPVDPPPESHKPDNQSMFSKNTSAQDPGQTSSNPPQGSVVDRFGDLEPSDKFKAPENVPDQAPGQTSSATPPGSVVDPPKVLESENKFTAPGQNSSPSRQAPSLTPPRTSSLKISSRPRKTRPLRT